MVALLQNPQRGMRLVDNADRRIFPRRELQLRVEGRRVDNTVQAHKYPELNLQLRDLSFGGLSAITNSPLERGERVAVYFPQMEGHGAWDARGRVLRCDPSTFGYRIAVEFDPLPAA